MNQDRRKVNYQELLLNGLSPDVIHMLLEQGIIKSLDNKDIKEHFLTWLTENKLDLDEKDRPKGRKEQQEK